MNTSLRFSIVFAFLITLFLPFQAATITTIDTGNWSNTATWDCGCIPTSVDDVVINQNVTLDVSATVNNLTITSSKSFSLISPNTIDILGNLSGASSFGQAIIGTGNISMSGAGTANISNNLYINNLGTKTLNKNINITNGYVYFRYSDLLINGAFTVANNSTQNVIFYPGSTIMGTGASSIFRQGTNSVLTSRNPDSFVGSNVTFDASTNVNTVEFTGVSKPNSHIIPAGSYSKINFKWNNSLKVLDGDIEVHDELRWLSQSASLDVSVNNYDIRIFGKWVDLSSASDPFIQREGTVYFVGSSLQAMSSTPVDTFYNIVIDQSVSDEITFSNTFYVENELSMLTGDLRSSINNVHIEIGPKGSITGGSVDSYVWAHGVDALNGNFIRKFFTTSEDIFFPIGNNNDYQPITFKLNSASFDSGDYIDMKLSTTETGHPNKPAGVHSDFYWMVDASGFTGGINYNVESGYRGRFSDGEDEFMGLGLWDGGAWELLDPADAVLDVLSSTTGLTTVPSTFDFAGIYDAVFPVEILDFTATPIDNTVILDWSTASETNNAFFTVEKSKDGTNFEYVGLVEGGGTSSKVLDYNIEDNTPYTGMSLYRLTQTDFNGDERVTATATVLFTEAEGRGEVKLLGNPFSLNESITADFNSQTDGKVSVELYDMGGMQLYSTQIEVNKGSNLITLDALNGQLSSGIYHLILHNNLLKLNTKVIIN